MPRKSPLRAVTDGEKAAKQLTVSEAADKGTQRELLVALRSRIARTVTDPITPPRDLAALSRRLIEIAKEIAAIDTQDGGDDFGDAAGTPDAEFDPEAL